MTDSRESLLEPENMNGCLGTATRLPHDAPALAFPARKVPSQQRSRMTVDAILEASARILEEGGQLDTNRIAERAGVGVATLYEYFGDKSAVLAALSRKTRESLIHRVADCLRPACAVPVAAGLRMLIGAALRGDVERPAMATALDQAEAELFLEDDHDWSRRNLNNILSAFLAHHGVSDDRTRDVLADDICAMTAALTAAAQDRGVTADETLVDHIAKRLTPIVQDVIAGFPATSRES